LNKDIPFRARARAINTNQLPELIIISRRKFDSNCRSMDFNNLSTKNRTVPKHNDPTRGPNGRRKSKSIKSLGIETPDERMIKGMTFGLL
jgi:hypothetical protein